MTNASSVTIGLDVGDRNTHFCVLDAERSVIQRGSFATRPKNLSQELSKFPKSRVAFEAGSQSLWMSWQLEEEQFKVHVVDPRRVQLISSDPRKTDRRDAETLARLESAAPELLGNVHHRGKQAQADLAVLRARDGVVRARTMLIQHVRGTSKEFGTRLPSVSTGAFSKKVQESIPEVLRPALEPMLEQIASLSRAIRDYDRLIARIAQERYPEVEILKQVHGVGPVTALAFVLSIEDPGRFADSRSVGSWLGLCPKSHASGDSNPQLGVSKAGDRYLRRILVQCAHYILGPFGRDCDLRRFGARLATRGGRRAKKQAAVAVARKLAVLLHRLWRDGLAYDPLHEAHRKAARQAG